MARKPESKPEAEEAPNPATELAVEFVPEPQRSEHSVSEVPVDPAPVVVIPTHSQPPVRSRVRSLSYGGSRLSTGTSASSSPPPVEQAEPPSVSSEAETQEVPPETPVEIVSVHTSGVAGAVGHPVRAEQSTTLAAHVARTTDGEQSEREPAVPSLEAIESAFAAITATEMGHPDDLISDEQALDNLHAWELAATRQNDDATSGGRRIRSLHGFSWSR